MTLHVVQHVAFEGPGRIAGWAEDRGVTLNVVPVYSGSALPTPAADDGVVLLGGPMSVHDTAAHPWITGEIGWLTELAGHGRPVLGICLGAQLLARALGAPVTRCPHREIGWFPVIPDDSGDAASDWLEPGADVFHWHGEQFALPEAARPVASTDACPVQGFQRDRLTGLQFHLETTPQIAADLVEACGDELDGGPWVQDIGSILGTPPAYARLHRQLDKLLDRLFQPAP